MTATDAGAPVPVASPPPPADHAVEGPKPGAMARARAAFAHTEAEYFPARDVDPANRSGVREPGKTEVYGYLLALAIALFAVYLVERAMAVYPIPSGGDPGQWIAGSYAFVGLPYPTWLLPGQYPPLVFPILGGFLRLVGPLQAGRLFVAFCGIGIGLGTYYLARSVLRSRSVALAVETFVVFSPTLVQAYFSGIYPNLLGLMFLGLAVAFLVRFARSGSETHAFLFWVATAATVLSHPLSATLLTVTLVLLGGFLVSQRRIPRSFYRGPVALAGFAVFLLSVGGFYGLAYLVKVPQPHFIAANAFSYVRNGLGSLYYVLLNPYFASTKPSLPNAELISLVSALFLALVLVGVRLLAPERLTLGMVTVLTMLLAVIGGAIVGWKLSIVTDYVRFPLYLVVPLGLGLGLVFDAFLHWTPAFLTRVLPTRPVGPPSAAGRRRSGGAARTPPRPAAPTWVGVPPGWTALGTAAFALAVVLLIIGAGAVTEPSLAADEQQNSSLFHDSTFLAALGDIQHSGVSGNVFAPGGAAKWTRALLDREAYTPFVAPRFTFDPGHLTDEEVTYFAMVARDAVTNSLVAATIAGTNGTLDNETPDYEASANGVFLSVASLAADNFNVTVSNGSANQTESVRASPTIFAPSSTVAGATSPAVTTMSMLYVETGFDLNVTVTIPSVSPQARFSLVFAADPGWAILAVRGNMTGPAFGVGATNFQTGTTLGEVVLTPASTSANLRTFVNVTPTSSVGRPQSLNRPAIRTVARVPLNVTAGPGGVPEVNFTLAFSTPRAQNLVSGLPNALDAPTIWAQWGVRFVLATNESQLIFSHPSAILWVATYLQGEYGARVLGVEGTWTVLLLPAPSG
ncbi:MAG: hypothetical protein L3K01_01965 [Thermoplasmata archaeon]|nr:hypothetical protein [Thermoplasmata archaeon]